MLYINESISIDANFTGLRLKYSFIPAVVTVDKILFVIQYTPNPAGTDNEKYPNNNGKYFNIRCDCCIAGSSDGGVSTLNDIVWAMINNAGIVRYAIVSCQPKDGVKLFQLANNQSAERSPYTGPSKSGNHKNDSSNCFVVAKFKNDLYNAINTGI
jgi:hypothetical protein